MSRGEHLEKIRDERAAPRSNGPAGWAPGKVILFGEYAALTGGRTVVAAVDRGVSCWRRTATDCIVEGVGFGRSIWRGGDWEGAALPFAAAALEALGHPSGDFLLDSEAFQLTLSSGRRMKLGLGSSAASTVALIEAASEIQLSPRALFKIARDAHFLAQGRLGSGADIAASAWGGLSLYQRGGDHSEAQRRGLPLLPDLLFAWTGVSADTRELVRAVEAWGRSQPAQHRAILGELEALAGYAEDAIQANDLVSIEALVNEGARALRALSQASNTPLWIDAHSALARHAAAVGVSIKPTGAGGGDLVWLYSADQERLTALTERLTAEGFELLSLPLAPERTHHRSRVEERESSL